MAECLLCAGRLHAQSRFSLPTALQQLLSPHVTDEKTPPWRALVTCPGARCSWIRTQGYLTLKSMHAVSLFTLPFIRLSRTHLYIGLRQLTRSLPFSPLGDKNTDGCTEHLRLCHCQVQITELALLRRCVSVYPHTHTRTHHRHTQRHSRRYTLACTHT